MKKFLAIALVAVLAMTAVFANGSSESASEIKIGFIGPLTGDYANYGTLCRQAVEMAIDECNAKGGINGSTVKLVAEDSEGDPNKALAAMEKLANTDKVCAVVGPVLTGEAFSVGPVACELGVLAVTPSASHKDVTNQGDYIFRTTPSDGLQGEVAGKYWAQVLGYKKIATLYAKNDYSQGLAEGMKESFEAEGGKIVAEETFMVGDKDFKTQLTKLKNTDAEAIYIPDYTAEMAQILEQASQLGVNKPFLSGDGFLSEEIYQLAGEYTDGVVYTASAQLEETSLVKEFRDAYTEKWGIGPDSFATNSYDATNILLSVIAKVGTDRKAIRDGFAAVKDYEGVNGTINFAENGDLVAYQGIYEVEGNTPKYVGAFKIENGKVVKVN
ncbi:MAG: ABC transporter substrate-binding protein [Candidatus Ornithospirochaeta sp.]